MLADRPAALMCLSIPPIHSRPSGRKGIARLDSRIRQARLDVTPVFVAAGPRTRHGIDRHETQDGHEAAGSAG